MADEKEYKFRVTLKDFYGTTAIFILEAKTPEQAIQGSYRRLSVAGYSWEVWKVERDQ